MKIPLAVDPSHVSFTSAPPTEQSVIVALRPLGSIADATSIEFCTGRHTDVVIDPQSIQLSIKIKVTDSANKPLVALLPKTHLMAANNMLNSFFSGITIKANNQQVFHSNHHNYVSYLANMLNTTADYRSSVLRSSGWYEMTDVIDVGSFAAKSFITVFDLSKEVVLAGQLDCPFLKSDKFLPPGTELAINLMRAPTDVFLVTDVTSGFKLHLLEAELTLRYIRLEPPLLSALNEALISKPYLYPFKHVETRAITLPSGIANYSVPNLHIGKIPSMIIFTLILSTDYKGALARSPFIFTAASLNSFYFSLNGVKVPVRELKFDTDTEDGIVPLFNYVNDQLGLSAVGPSPNLTIAKYAKNFFFVAQNLKKDVTNSSLSSPARGGSLSLDISLKTALAASHTLLIVSEFSKSVLSFNPDGSVTAQQ